MGTCAHCGTVILFGGKKINDRHYCSDTCAKAGEAHAAAEQLQIPHDIIERHAQQLFDSDCPVCGGRGPVDIHVSHQVMSFFVLTQWKSNPRLSCRSCANQDKIYKTLLTAVAGWWGFPWGLIMTPVQITRNICGLLANPKSAPSDALKHTARISLVNLAAQRDANQANQS
ncbi:MAG: hypothetical protein LBK76_08795 [Verrucomicrobiales bacterium]|jgi:hypothetical protein|nr:hypothetical protein [Verrucomicrobiales bacterium]